MATVTFEKAQRWYPGNDKPTVPGIDLEIGDGEFMVLVGPSGCGKTTALRMVAGLEEISEGALKIGDRVVNHVPPPLWQGSQENPWDVPVTLGRRER